MNYPVIFLLLIGYCIAGCVPPSYTPSTYTPPAYTPPTFFAAKYDISLTEVERPAKAKQRYGNQKIEKVQEEGISKYYFEDDMVKILWLPSAYKIAFILNNKTDHSIKIVWDEASFVDTTGGGHRVMHSDVKYTDRNNPQPPTVVVRKGSIEDIVFPTDYVYWKEGYYSRYSSIPGGWQELPLLPSFQSGGSSAELKAKAEANIGKTLQVLLPLQIEDVLNDYIFSFKVNEVEVTQK